MGFRNLIQKQVQNAMRIIGDDDEGLARPHTFVQVGAETYDPNTRRTSATETVFDGVPMPLVRFSIDDMDEEVRPQTDRIALIAALDLPVQPDENDKIMTSDGIVYTVKRLLSDPADALHKLHIRRE